MCMRAYSVHCVRMCMCGAARIQARASTCQWSSAHMLMSAWCAPPHVYCMHMNCVLPAERPVPYGLKAQVASVVAGLASREAPPATGLQPHRYGSRIAEGSAAIIDPVRPDDARRVVACHRPLPFAVGSRSDRACELPCGQVPRRPLRCVPPKLDKPSEHAPARQTWQSESSGGRLNSLTVQVLGEHRCSA